MTESTQAAVEPWMFQAPQQGPAPAASAPAQGSESPTPDQARANLEQLRTDRLEGKVTDRDFFERSDYLARIAHGEQGVQLPPKRLEHMTPAEQADHLRDEAMQPAKMEEYDLPAPKANPSDSEPDPKLQAFDVEIREAMAAMGVPKQYGRTFYERVDALVKGFTQASPETIEAHQANVGERLRKEWGEQFGANMQTVNDLLADAAEHHPLVARLLDHTPYAFIDPWVLESLRLIAEHRKRRSRGK